MSNAEIQQLNRLLIIQNAELLAELEETKNRLQERTEVSTFWYNKSQELEKSSIQTQPLSPEETIHALASAEVPHA